MILSHVASAGDTDVNVFVVRMQGLPYKAKEEDIVSFDTVFMVQIFKIAVMSCFHVILTQMG